MYNDAEHSEVVEKSPREELFNHKNKDWWSQGELCYTNEKNICAERFSDVSYVMSQEDLFWCLNGNLWHKWWGAVGLRCESSLLLRFHASLLDAKWEEQKWSPFLPTRMLVWHAEIKNHEEVEKKIRGFWGPKLHGDGMETITWKMQPTSSGWLRILLFVETSVPNTR